LGLALGAVDERAADVLLGERSHGSFSVIVAPELSRPRASVGTRRRGRERFSGVPAGRRRHAPPAGSRRGTGGGGRRAPPHGGLLQAGRGRARAEDRKSTRLNSSHVKISYGVFC